MRIISYLAILVISYSLKAQTSLLPLFDDKSVMHVYKLNLTDAGFPYYQIIKEYSTLKDTIINSEKFSVINISIVEFERYVQTRVTSSTKIYLLQKGNLILEFNKSTASVDTASYFLGLTVGDSVRTYKQPTAVIEKVFKIAFGSDSVRAFQLSYLYKPGYDRNEGVFIDGIGSINGSYKTEFNMVCHSYFYEYICLKYKGIYYSRVPHYYDCKDYFYNISLTESSTTCGLLTAIDEEPSKEKEHSYFSPNKELKFSQAVSDITIFDLTGRVHLSLSSSLQTLYLTDLRPGVYMCSYKINNTPSVMKFICTE